MANESQIFLLYDNNNLNTKIEVWRPGKAKVRQKNARKSGTFGNTGLDFVDLKYFRVDFATDTYYSIRQIILLNSAKNLGS